MRRLLLAVGLLFSSALPALARGGEDRASVGNDITIAEGDTAGDVACVFCTVHVHGDVRGDVAVLFGKIEVDPGTKSRGDVAALGADLNLGEGAIGRGAMWRLLPEMQIWRSGAMIHGSTHGASWPNLAAASVCSAADSNRIDLADRLFCAAQPVSVSGISAWPGVLVAHCQLMGKYCGTAKGTCLG